MPYDDRHVFGCEKSKHEGVRRGHCQYKYKTKQDGLHVEGRVGDSVLLTLLENRFCANQGITTALYAKRDIMEWQQGC